MTSKLTITDDKLSALLSEMERSFTGCQGHGYIDAAEEYGDMISALRELQECRKTEKDSEPVAVVEPSDYVTAAQLLGEGPARKAVHELYEGALRIGDKLYRHAQPAPKTEPEPIAWLNDAYLARGVVDGEAGSEDAGPGYIPVYREAGPQPAPVVPDEMLCEFYEVDSWPDLVRELVKHVEQLQDSARRNVKPWEDTFPETLLPAYIERVKQADDACRAAILAAAPQSPGSEPATVPGKWIPVSERMPENDGAYLCWDNRYVTTYAFIFGAWQANQFIAKNITHWMPLPADPQEVNHG
nr:DUF551 domain-containing protein [Raoultella ornithinolytica]